MRRFVISIVTALAAVGLGAGTSVLAAPAENISFFHGEDGNAHWGPNQSYILLSETTTVGAYAGALLMHVGATAPVIAPSFNDVDSINENGGGSPRLVIAFSDGGTIVGYRLQMETTMQTSDLHWDSMGGSAGFLYNSGYTVALADHNGSPVVAAYLVTDSGWEGSAYTNRISNITYDDNTYAS